jgi:glycogen(starch) synthase
MKVLFWTPIFWPDIGGIEKVSLRHVQDLKKRGYECMVISSFGRVAAPDYSEIDGIPIHRFAIESAFHNNDLRQILTIQKKIETLKRGFAPDIDHLNFGGPTPIGFFYLRTAKIKPVPLIIALHGSMLGLDEFPGSITGQVLKSATWTTACSSAMLEDARSVVPEITTRSSTVYIGCSDVNLEPSPLPLEFPRILCLGRLVPEKGFELAIRAFAELVKKHPNARLIITGDGPSKPDLEKLADQLRVDKFVEFTGAINPDEVYTLINTATMMVIPSRWREAFGLVALEASQMARPVIASDVGGLSEAVLDGQTGLLYENGDARALTAAMLYLLDHPGIARKLGQNGRERALTHFTWQKYIEAYDSLYQSQKPQD